VFQGQLFLKGLLVDSSSKQSTLYCNRPFI